MKTGANALAEPSLAQMITNVPLMAGYSLYGLSTVLLILALREGHLSILYPIISLTYVWVTLLSIVIFNEQMNWFKGIGLAIIVMGVALLGRNGRE
jgi:multidrug transporter EmrE-like cation transporter